MKYIIMFCSTAEDQEVFAKMTQIDQQTAYGRVGQWFADNRAKIVGGEELESPQTATTIRFDASGNTFLTDGPHVEAKEIIGGFALVEVADLDEAISLAKTWPGGPGGSVVEVRPLVAH